MRLTVTQIRIGILVLNLGLTLLVGVQAVYAVFSPPALPSPDVKVSIDELAYVGRMDATKSDNLVKDAIRVGEMFQPKPQPVAPPPGEAVKGPEAPPAPPVGPDELPPGPLDAEWEYVQGFIYHDDPGSSWAVLQKKDPSAAAGGAAGTKKATTRTPPRIIRSSVPGRPPRPSAPGAPGAPVDKKTLKARREWKDDDLKIHIWVVEITPDHFKYEDPSQPGRLFALARDKKSPYAPSEKGLSLKAAPEEADPNAPEVKKYLLFDKPDYDAAFSNRKAPPSPGASPPSASSAPKGTTPAHPANAPARPLSKEEQLGQLKETMEKIPKAERAKLEKALQGLKK